MELFLRSEFGGLTFGGAYTWRGLFSEFYGTVHYHAHTQREINTIKNCHVD